METIREQLMYKDGKVSICFLLLSIQERYELIRLLLATRTKDVHICIHDTDNPYINHVIKKLDVKFIQCWKECLTQTEFDLRKACMTAPQSDSS